MVLKIILIIILERSELIHIIHYLLKKLLAFNNVIILIKSVVNENENKYYYNIFLEKGSYKYKWMCVYYKCYIMIELKFLKKLILMKQVHQKSVIPKLVFLKFEF